MHDRVETIAGFLSDNGVRVVLTETSDYQKDEDDHVYVTFGPSRIRIAISNRHAGLQAESRAKDGSEKIWPIRQTMDEVLADVKQAIAEAAASRHPEG